MFGGVDSADTQNEIAKLPDGLGAREGTETLEAVGKPREGSASCKQYTTRRTLSPHSPTIAIQRLM